MATDWLRYNNQGATRSQPLSNDLAAALEQIVPSLGLAVEVFSGGQPSAGGGARVGSTRHDHGNAADVFFYQGDERLDWANPQHQPIFQDIVRRGREAGLTGFGAGPGYMQPGAMHLGFGNPGVWGAGGRSANAPSWLVEAFNGGGSSPSAVQAIQTAAPTAAPGGSPLVNAYAPQPRSAPSQPAPQAQVAQQRYQPMDLSGLFSNPNVNVGFSPERSDSGRQTAVQTTGGQSGYLNNPFSRKSDERNSRSNSGDARAIRIANSRIAREVTGSGALNKDSIRAIQESGRDMYRR